MSYNVWKSFSSRHVGISSPRMDILSASLDTEDTFLPSTSRKEPLRIVTFKGEIAQPPWRGNKPCITPTLHPIPRPLKHSTGVPPLGKTADSSWRP
ncbi:hypothetical protein NPIL_170861 [Nephila pilipes]|uniref:Uncharacterized protein n=1 Tax=Nephila pilipes TaxID=299642 RepID=A0A8X6PZ59_NEPPI|nr:hypothetical protein NPIL_170861 [Nephila pilipes]